MKRHYEKEFSNDFKVTIIRRGRSSLKVPFKEIPVLIKNALIQFGLICLLFLIVSIVLGFLEIY